MGQVLYRKYRSKSLGEIVGQDHITSTLSNALKTGKVSHAYLLTGPRGTGKTSIARILAHEINGLPYSEDTHFDIIEIDAASNNGVEDVRELREKVQSSPSSAKYKVYIIDEVHMLTKQAFNALLKTLEEPPEHVVFILATTEAHKLPETIISRTQRYSFRPVPIEKVIEHLKSIAKSEKITISDDALRLIAEHGEGSFRDSISLLDQVSTYNDAVTAEHVEQLLGRPPTVLVDALLDAVAANDTAKVVQSLRALYDSGFEAATISVQLGKKLRADLLASSAAISPQKTIKMLQQLVAVPASPSPAQLLELALLSQTVLDDQNQNEVKPKDVKNVSQVKSQTSAVTPTAQKVSAKTKPAAVTIPAQKEEPEPVTPSNVDTQDTVTPPEVPEIAPDTETPVAAQGSLPQTINADELWHLVLQDIKQSHNTLYGIARMAKPTLDGDTLILATKFAFHQKRLSETKNRDILSASISTHRGAKTVVTCVVSQSTDKETDPEQPAKPDIAAISNIFGGAELLD